MELVKVLLALVVLDVITGFTKSVIHQTTISKSFFIGILKKVSVFFVIALVFVIDPIIEMQGSLFNTVNLFFIASEGLSILENAGECGVPIPEKLRNVLKVLKEEGDEKDGY